jgi:hypothetical protein
VSIPLNFKSTTFSGGLHASGKKVGSEEAMKLSVSNLELKKKAEP